MRSKLHRENHALPAMKSIRILAAASLLTLWGCEDAATGTFVGAKAVMTSPNPWPTPEVAAPNAPPKILALWMNETSIPSGSDWTGHAITTTNVASLEVRTESFSFVAQRTAFGDFRFRQHVLDMVPFYKRSYLLHVLARNTAGQIDERVVPIRFR